MGNILSETEFNPGDTIQPLPEHVKAALDKGWAEPENGERLFNTQPSKSSQ